MRHIVKYLHLVAPAIALLLISAAPARAAVKIHPMPRDMPRFQDITITADGQDVFPYAQQVNFTPRYQRNPLPPTEPTPVACFDFSGTVKVAVRRNAPFSSVTVRPLSLSIKPKVANNAFEFTLSQPTHLTLEFDGDLHGALHLFASSIEANSPTRGSAGVRYYGPGVHAGNITLQSNETVYLAGGAVLRGGIRGNGVRNARVLGRGILHGGGIRMENCSNIEFRGFHNFRPNEQGWMLHLIKCNGVKIVDYKSIGCGPNSDGIDPVNCSNVQIRGCFLRQWDDCIAIKGIRGGQDSHNFEISDCILWNDLGRVFQIGYETRSDTIRDIYIHDCTVIHARDSAVLGCSNGDRAYVTNVRYENIVVEHSLVRIIELWIGTAKWTRDRERGRINGVSYKNIILLSGSPLNTGRTRNRIQGFDASHKVENVVIDDFIAMGNPITNLQEGNFEINQHTENITFAPRRGTE